MRIRSTKPEFWRSERVCSIEDWGTRLLLKGLESYVDDNGVGKDDLALIVADVFPRDLSRNPTGTLRRVSEGLDTLSEAGLLWRYEVDGTRLLYIAFWESIQRIEKPTKGRFRRPDGTMNYRDSEIRESSGNVPGTVREPSGLEQGNRGTGEQTSSSDSADAEPRPDVEDLLDYLDAAIKKADPDARTPNRTKGNRDAARRLLDLDGRTPEQVKAAIDFATTDEFWAPNIRSMSKLRDKYDQLRAQAMRKRPAPPQTRDTYAALKVVGQDG